MRRMRRALPVALASVVLVATVAGQEDLFEAFTYVPPTDPTKRVRLSSSDNTRGSTITAVGPTLSVVAPAEYAGLTTSPHPTLYYFASDTMPGPLIFRISKDSRTPTLEEITLDGPVAAGLNKIELSADTVALEFGQVYVWSVDAGIMGGEFDHLTATGHIEVRDPSTLPTADGRPLSEALTAESEERHPALYANNSIWYDGFATAADLIEETRSDRLRRSQIEMLEGEGIDEVAKYIRELR